FAVARSETLQVGDVPQRVGRALGGQIRRVRRTPAGPLAGVDLDQLAPMRDAHELAVGADLHPGAEQVPWHRVERLGDPDVVIPRSSPGWARRWRARSAPSA